MLLDGGPEEAGEHWGIVFFLKEQVPQLFHRADIREAKMADSTRQVFGNHLPLRLSKGALWDLHTQVAWERQGEGGMERV